VRRGRHHQSTLSPAIISGRLAIALIPSFSSPRPVYNNAIPPLMQQLLPNGVLGVALTGLLAAFMAGMAANVSGFNTVFTYDLWRAVLRQGPARRLLPAGGPDHHGDRHLHRYRLRRSSPPDTRTS
jgi:Sodium:solute symporter family.